MSDKKIVDFSKYGFDKICKEKSGALIMIAYFETLRCITGEINTALAAWGTARENGDLQEPDKALKALLKYTDNAYLYDLVELFMLHGENLKNIAKYISSVAVVPDDETKQILRDRRTQFAKEYPETHETIYSKVIKEISESITGEDSD